MRSLSNLAIGGLLLFCLVCGPSMALGPVDGEVAAVWWDNEFTDNSGGSTDAAAPGFRANLWMKDFGVRAAIFASDPDDLAVDKSDYLSLDVMYKAVSVTDKNYFAVGLGWEEFDMSGLGDTSGVRLALEGRVGMGNMAYAYGEGAYLPSLDDISGPGGNFTDVDGTEYELGVGMSPAPFISLKAGYRETTFDFSQAGGGGSVESSGFLIATGFHF